MSELEPSQAWWTAQELSEAGLPDLPATKKGVNALAARHNWSAYPGLARRRKGRGGGWEYHWSLLPLAARRKLLSEIANEPAPKLDRQEAWAAFENVPQHIRQKAEGRLKAIQLFESLRLGHVSVNLAASEVARMSGVSTRTLYNWIDLVSGIAPADRLAYLVPRQRLAVRRDTKAPIPKSFMDYLKSVYLRLEQPTFAQSYRLAVKEAKRKGWNSIPQKRTAQRRLHEEVPRVTRVYMREGEAGLLRCFPPQIRDRSGMVAMEAVNADCHKIDVFVQWPDGTVNRPQIVAFQDLYSRKILSWRVDHSPNKVMVMSAFGEMIECWGIPQHCLFDNGREFANKWLTAGAETRFRFKIRDDDPLGVLPLLDIKIHWATPGHGQAKPVERSFRDLASDVAKDPRFDGAYVGPKPDAKPENYGERAVPLDKFIQVLAEGIDEHNARGGRLGAGLDGRSFDAVFEESYASATIRKATEEQHRLWLMAQHTGKLHRDNGQLRVHGNFYYSDWMSEHAGARVVARFDPEDLHAGVFIYDTEGVYLGFAECRQKVGFFDLTEAQEQARRNQRIRRQQRALAKEHRPIPIQEIAAGLDTDQSAAPGGVAAKVVAPAFGTRRTELMMAAKVVADPVPDEHASEVEAQQAALIADLDAHRERSVQVTEDDGKALFLRARDLERQEAGGASLTRDQRKWLSAFQQSDEYRTWTSMVEDFGEAVLNK